VQILVTPMNFTLLQTATTVVAMLRSA